MIKTLDGIKVVEFSIAAAGPACGKQLAEYGADVIVVEPIAGATTRWVTNYFDFWHGSKKSLPLNVKTPEGMAALLKLIDQADVFLTNYRAKSLRKLGLDYASLKQRNPRLVYGMLYGWGANGPLKDEPAFDVTAFWARGGMLRDFAEKGSILVPPQGVGDCAAAQALAAGICAALFRRERTNEGMEVSISLFAEGIYLNNSENMRAQFGTEFQQSRKAPAEALANTFQCKDGWVVMFDNQFERHFNSFLTAIGRPDLVGDPRWTCLEDTRKEKAVELTAIFDEAFAKLTVEEAVERVSACDISISRCYASIDAMSDPQALENDYVFDWTLSSGAFAETTVKMPTSPVFFNGEGFVKEYRRAPRLGENTVEVLKELGYTEEEIHTFADKGITVIGE